MSEPKAEEIPAAQLPDWAAGLAQQRVARRRIDQFRNTVVATLPTGAGSALFAFEKFIGSDPTAASNERRYSTPSEWGLALMALLLTSVAILALRRDA